MDFLSNCIYNIDIYTGKEEIPTKNLGKRTVIDLISGLVNRGHIRYIDSFYSSEELYQVVEKKCLYVVVYQEKSKQQN